MKIDCTIDGKTLTLSLNSNKPLSLILRENIGIDNINHCNGDMCGLCTVLLDGKAVLSCLVPAFELNGKEVITFDSFQRTKGMKDIEKAYEIVGASPCTNCYSSRTMLFESLINEGITDRSEILKQLSLIKCHCMVPDDEVEIVHKAIDLRRKRNVRRPQFS